MYKQCNDRLEESVKKQRRKPERKPSTGGGGTIRKQDLGVRQPSSCMCATLQRSCLIC